MSCYYWRKYVWFLIRQLVSWLGAKRLQRLLSHLKSYGSALDVPDYHLILRNAYFSISIPILEDSLPQSNIVPQTSKQSLNVTPRGNLDHQVSNCGLLRSVSFLCFLLMSILTDSTCRAPKSFLPRPLLPPKLVKWQGQAGVSR